MHHQQLCLQTTVGNVICGMRHGHCVCESHDVKIFLILALFDWIAVTFLSDPHPSNTTGSFQVSRTKCQSNRLRYSVAGATKDAFGRLMCIHLVPWWVHHAGPVRQCSEVYRGWRLSFGKKSSDWEKRVFDIEIQWNKQYKQDNDGQWYKIRFASEWIVNWLIDVDRDLVMRWCYKVGSLPLWNWRRVCSARNLQMSSLPAVASVYSFRATWQEIYSNLFASITGNLIECRSGATKIYKIHAAI